MNLCYLNLKQEPQCGRDEKLKQDLKLATKDLVTYKNN